MTIPWLSGYGTVWNNTGEIPKTVSKWQSYTNLVQVIQEMGMWQAIFDLNTRGPHDEHVTSHRRDLKWGSVSLSAFGSLAVVLTLYIRHHIHEVTTAMMVLGQAEGHQWD